MSPEENDPRRPPALAWALGTAGLIPFIAAAVVVWTQTGGLAAVAAFAALSYGAVILSFIGGAHWGFAVARLGADADDRRGHGLLAASVVPSLAGWACLFVPAPYGVLALAACFLAVLGLDRAAAAAPPVPPWWLRLRHTLSPVAAALLALVALADSF